MLWIKTKKEIPGLSVLPWKLKIEWTQLNEKKKLYAKALTNWWKFLETE